MGLLHFCLQLKNSLKFFSGKRKKSKKSDKMTENEETFEKPRKNLNESFKKEEFVVKRGRGRPKKSSIQISCDFDCQESVLLNVTMQHSPSKILNHSKKSKKLFKLKKRNSDISNHESLTTIKFSKIHSEKSPKSEPQEIAVGTKPSCSPEVQSDQKLEESKNDQALNQSQVKRGRGRPPKRKPDHDPRFQDPQCSQPKSPESPKSEASTEDIIDEIPQKKQILQLEQENPSGSEVKKKRGRPPKSLKIKQNDLSPKITKIKLLKTSTKSPNFTVIENNDKNTEKRGRGRPPKALGLLGLKKKKKVQMSKLKKNRSPKISMIRRILKSRKLKKSAIKEDSSSEESNFNSEEESCEEIEKYMKTLGLRPADQMQEIDGEEKKKKRGRPRKIILTKFDVDKNKLNIEELQKRNEEMSREIWELSKINADLQNRLNYVPFLQEENHRLHLALNAEKQKLQKLSQQCGVGIPPEINDETEPQI